MNLRQEPRKQIAVVDARMQNSSTHVSAAAQSQRILQGSIGNGERKKNYAIAYLMAGCEVTKASCLGYVLNILVAKSMLDQHGFQGDLVCMIRMSSHETNATRLVREEEWLRRAGVVVKYLPTLKVDNFALAQLDKFRVLELAEYDRVLYLDSDAIPLCNLDYVFEASLSGYLSEYVAMGQVASPATGSIFLVTPKRGEFAKVMKIVRDCRMRGVGFDLVQGWGHVIQEPDEWRSMTQRGRNWTFYGAGADQGLLYHWLKYVHKNFTLLWRDDVETWRQVDTNYMNGTIPSYELEDGSRIAQVNRSRDFTYGCKAPRYDRGPWAQYHLYADHYHFAGLRKPWFQPIDNIPTNKSAIQTIEDLWWFQLALVNTTLELGLSASVSLAKPSLGGSPKKNDIFAPHVEIPSR